MARKYLILGLALSLGLFLCPERAQGQPFTTPDLLLPYFEVQVDPPNLTTLFAVGNLDRQEVPVMIMVYTNWGIPVLRTRILLGPHEVRTFNLRDWIVAGQLPDRTLSPNQLAHLHAALCGGQSPVDQLYYSTEVAPGLAAGYITLRIHGYDRPDILWGDFLIVNPDNDFAQGDNLVDIRPTSECCHACQRHSIRFMEGASFGATTRMVLWNDHRIPPSADPIYPEAEKVETDIDCYDEPGALLARDRMQMLPVQAFPIAQMNMPEPFGWLDIATEVNSFVGVLYEADDRYSVAMRSWCRRERQGPPDDEPEEPDPGITLEKYTNGVDGDAAPGAMVHMGDPVHWEYLVTNTGNIPLTDIVLSDDREASLFCPGNSLEPGESMTCTARGVALPCQYSNQGMVTAEAEGGSMQAFDPSHYYGDFFPGIHLEKYLNGLPASGDLVPHCPPMAVFTYEVTNTGEVPLHGITVTDDDLSLAITCPGDTLAPLESMLCTAQGVLEQMPYSNTGRATGWPPCGPPVMDEDTCQCGEPPPPPNGDEGCTPGYWKNHADSWPPTGYVTGQQVDSVFAQASGYPGIGTATLLEALNFGGGPGEDGAARILLRAGVAALLNATHSGVAYPMTGSYVVSVVDNALGTGGRDSMLALATALDTANNLGCPLN